jgi:hypothetical protein
VGNHERYADTSSPRCSYRPVQALRPDVGGVGRIGGRCRSRGRDLGPRQQVLEIANAEVLVYGQCGRAIWHLERAPDRLLAVGQDAACREQSQRNANDQDCVAQPGSSVAIRRHGWSHPNQSSGRHGRRSGRKPGRQPRKIGSLGLTSAARWPLAQAHAWTRSLSEEAGG